MNIEEKIVKIYNEDSRKISNKTNFGKEVGNPGYGETGYKSIENIIKYFNEYFNENTIFYDLGCGTGKIVYHIGLKYNPKKSCGIEFSKERCILADKIKEKYDINIDTISIVNNNILNCNISDATVIYMDNTLFPKDINESIYNIIPKKCLVISRQMLIKKSDQLKTNDIIINISSYISVGSNYGSSSIYVFLKG